MIHLISDDEPAGRPRGNRHENKVSASERREQMAEYYHANRERILEQRREKYRETNPAVDKIALHAAKIARIVNASGPRLVILVKGRPVLNKIDSVAAKKHYLHCKSIVGTYSEGAQWEQIADDLRAMTLVYGRR